MSIHSSTSLIVPWSTRAISCTVSCACQLYMSVVCTQL